MKKKIALGLILASMVFGMLVGITVGRISSNTTHPKHPEASMPRTLAQAQHKPILTSSSGDTTGALAGISLSPEAIDLGKIVEGESRQFSVRLNRPEGVPIRIESVRTSCPCLQFVPRKFIIDPYEDCVITFDLHSLTLHGDETRKFYIKIMEPKQIMLIGEVGVKVDRVPAKLLIKPEAIRFGAVQNEDKRIEVMLYNLTKQDVTLQVPSSSLKGVSATLNKTTIPAGGRIVVAADADFANGKTGPFRGAISIETSLPEHHVLQIPFEGTWHP